MTRNEFIKHCARYRISYRDIGKMVGLSKTRVAIIIGKPEDKYCGICRADTNKSYCVSCKPLVKKYTNLTN